ncbi:DUF3800 domain-containing protein [Comamonas sp. SY3]|uniref:DUF3800 domain-containing protein n=1 Tax=Comamonas sp. SY3 TaxID=3243601 RepID=UPI00359343FF
MSIIYCDEAGNTGANLLDEVQPSFILASNDFSNEEAADLLQHVRSGQTGESKFSNLRRRQEGINKVIKFLSDPRLNEHRVQISVFHKRYMVTTKIVDLIAENIFYEMGYDLYKFGHNLALSNFLYYVLPTMCGEEKVNNFLNSFVELIRKGADEGKDPFYEAANSLVHSCANEQLKKFLSGLLDPQYFNMWYEDYDWSNIDPAIPALFHQIVRWGMMKNARFDVVHDQSKPIMLSQQTFEEMMAMQGEDSQIIGPDRRKIQFPLKAQSLTQGDSTRYPQLQVADICAGSLNHFYKLHFANQKDELSEAVEKLGCLNWVNNAVIPQPHFTPEELGTNSADGTSAVDEIASYLQQRRSNRV